MHIKCIQLHVFADFQTILCTVIIGIRFFFLQFALHVSLIADLFQTIFRLGCMNAVLRVIRINCAVHIVELDGCH